MAILTGMGTESLGGFGREYYLAYALWANFVGRIASNWMYEFTMVDEIDTGKVNALLVRPISFYEFYLSQFMGYKGLSIVVSFWIPVVTCKLFNAPMDLTRLPVMIALLVCYLIFTHTLSFCVACLAFHLNRTHSLTAMKNMAITVLSGELIPLDLFPEFFKKILLSLPFSAGVYMPVAYVTGRIDHAMVMQGFVSIAMGMVIMGLIAIATWRLSIRAYTGTGA